MQERIDFFKRLEKLIRHLKSKERLDEVKTIALVYQVAFKLVEQSGKLPSPMAYQYEAIDISKNLTDRHGQEIHDCAASLIHAIAAGEAFDDLMTEFIEVEDLTNTVLNQFFTPKDLALLQSEINLSLQSLDSFGEDDYFWITDDTGCGAGSLILAHMKSMKEFVQGFEVIHYQSIAIKMADIDVDLSKIAFFQVVLSSLLHSCPLGIVIIEGKNMLTEYSEIKNRNQFVSNIQKYNRYQLENPA